MRYMIGVKGVYILPIRQSSIDESENKGQTKISELHRAPLQHFKETRVRSNAVTESKQN